MGGEGGSGRHDLAPVCKSRGTPEPPSDYQRFDYGDESCPEGLVIQSESECSEAIGALGITNVVLHGQGVARLCQRVVLCRRKLIQGSSTRERVGQDATTWHQFVNQFK